jgi:hypothetical protein
MRATKTTQADYRKGIGRGFGTRPSTWVEKENMTISQRRARRRSADNGLNEKDYFNMRVGDPRIAKVDEAIIKAVSTLSGKPSSLTQFARDINEHLGVHINIIIARARKLIKLKKIPELRSKGNTATIAERKQQAAEKKEKTQSLESNPFFSDWRRFGNKGIIDALALNPTPEKIEQAKNLLLAKNPTRDRKQVLGWIGLKE